MQLKKLTHTAKEVLLDPGFGFALSGMLLYGFISLSPLGLIGCAAGGALIGGIKALQVLDPPFMKKDNLFTRIVKDPRTPLCVMGLALLVVTGGIMSTNLASVWSASASFGQFIAKGWTSAILPALSSATYAICNFGFAADIGRAEKIRKGLTKPEPMANPSAKQMLKLAVKRPETYFVLGTVTTGLIAGGLSLITLPLLATGYLTGMKNIIKNRPSYTGHTNLHFSAVSALLGGIGLRAGLPFLAASYTMDTFYLLRVEMLSTPGGFKQISQDIRGSLQALKQRLSGDKKTPSSAVPQQRPATTSALLVAANNNRLKTCFEQSTQPAPTASAASKNASKEIKNIKYN